MNTEHNTNMDMLAIKSMTPHMQSLHDTLAQQNEIAAQSIISHDLILVVDNGLSRHHPRHILHFKKFREYLTKS